MLAFHNEHIASCAFLTYFSPETSATPATSPTTGAQATLHNDKQSIAGVTAYPCGALNVRRLRWQQNPQSLGYPYPRLQLQRHQQPSLRNQPSSSGRLCLSSSNSSRHNLRDFCKTQAIC
ncbi:uncharacterized protein LOC108104007 [Drosophila eugracilis]|uniref:uncharacterized protein LOC108104007 n=1 Tax=Drosophila eugracilis TaxID=29029 RepID=UPI0007E7D982|nr:uncharacterized protein LOC108104007 [Drosophila eugracilis]